MEILYNSISEFMQVLFGNYVPISYTDASGVSVIPAGFAGVNWEYILSVALFGLIVYSILRIVGGLICRNY